MLSYSHNEICGSLVFGGPGITRSRGDGPGRIRRARRCGVGASENQRDRPQGSPSLSSRVHLERTRPKPKKKVVGSGVDVLLRSRTEVDEYSAVLTFVHKGVANRSNSKKRAKEFQETNDEL